MKMIEAANADCAFRLLFRDIMTDGVDTSIGTKALYDVMISLSNPQDRIITCPERKFSVRYAEREWAWYVSGDRSVAELKKYAPIWDTMHKGDNIVNSNYGWQWYRNDQLKNCIEQLKADKASRRAWLTIFDGKEKADYEKDTPCTLSVGFDVRDDKLNMTVLMRSNDLVFGFCNDQYCFSKLQEYVATTLGLKMGTYVHYAHDMHIYSRHFNLIKI